MMINLQSHVSVTDSTVFGAFLSLFIFHKAAQQPFSLLPAAGSLLCYCAAAAACCMLMLQRLLVVRLFPDRHRSDF